MEFDLENKRHTRHAYGDTLRELGKEHPEMVVLDADLSCSTKTYKFADEYPDRFLNVGCQEQNLMGISAGLALEDHLVYTSCFAMFGAGRGWEQIRNSIAYDKLNVKIVLTHAGLTVGKDGSSHQIIEDLSLMRSIPNMQIFCPADFNETRALTRHVSEIDGPTYMRLSREKSPNIYPDDYDFNFNTPNTLMEGDDVAILTCGFMTAESIKAAQKLAEEDISARVLDMHTIKQIDKSTIIDAARDTGAIVSAEEHSIYGGLGSAVAEVLAEHQPTHMKQVAIRDRFGRSGPPLELMEAYNLTSRDIVKAAKEVIDKK